MRTCAICEYRIKGDGKNVLPNEGRTQLMGDGKSRYHQYPHDCIALLRADLYATDAIARYQATEIADLRRRLVKLERGNA